MTRRDDLQRLKQLLNERRESILGTLDGTEGERRALHDQERDPEHEENAQTESADYTLSQLAENGRRELALIDAAFERMNDGSYGECLDCGADIPFARLEALPYAVRCGEDAAAYEREVNGPTPPPSL